MKVFNIAANIFLAVIIFGAIAFLLAPRFGLLGPLEVKIVRSGSMEPTIKTGSIVLIAPQAAGSYQVGDVITFGADTKTAVPTSHRVVSIREEEGMAYYTTKGEANNAADQNETPANKVIGKIIFSLPYVGYIFAFSKTTLGFALIVEIPAALIILYELLGIFDEVKKLRARKKAKRDLDAIVNREVSDIPDAPLERRVTPVRLGLVHFDVEMPALTQKKLP